MTVKIAAT